MPGITYQLTRGDSIGLTLALEASFLSLTSVSAMFLIMFRNIRRGTRQHPHTFHLIRDPIDLYILLLFMADLIQGVGTTLHIRWIHSGEVVEGPYCTAQGAIQQLGETGVAITTLVIAIHTFVGVWWRRGVHAILAAKIIMAIVWVFIICFVTAGFAVNGRKDYAVPTPYWCWLGSHYPLERIFGEYIWLWLTLIFSVFTYIPLYFCSRGNIVVSDEVWWKFELRHVENPAPGHLRALGIIAYPLVYSILVLPISVVRWIGFHQERHGGMAHIPAAATIGLNAIYCLSGFLNVVLLLTTRPPDTLLLFRWKHPEELPEAEGQLPMVALPMVRVCSQCGAMPIAAHPQPEPEQQPNGLPPDPAVPPT